MIKNQFARSEYEKTVVETRVKIAEKVNKSFFFS